MENAYIKIFLGILSILIATYFVGYFPLIFVIAVTGVTLIFTGIYDVVKKFNKKRKSKKNKE